MHTNHTISAEFNTVREQTARLLATENITVIQDAKAQTAYFDLKTRVLALPVWKDMTNSQYDMLIGHEVGHALFTPNGNGGWVDTAKTIAADGGFPNNPVAERAAQTMLNVVEDARIERLVKDRYPGLRRDFFSAYSDFHGKRDIFGLRGVDLSKLSLSDRLNLHFKIGPFQPIPFSTAERSFITRMEAAVTWTDVVAIARDLFNAESQGGIPQPQLIQATEGEEGEEGIEVEAIDGDPSDGEGEGEGENPSDAQDSTDSGSGSSGSEESEEDGDGGENPQSAGAGEAEGEGEGKQPQPKEDDTEGQAASAANTGSTGSKEHNRCIPRGASTAEALDQEMRRQVDHRGAKRTYVKVDTGFSSTDHVLSCKDYLAVMRRWASAHGDEIHRNNLIELDRAIERMVADTKSSITTFAREFEMRKTADEHRRTVESKSGRIDMDRAWQYRISDNLFKTATTMRDGKNHGFVMFVDFSGSMQPCMEQTLRQLYMLFQFCKKVGIPFDVYAFGAGIRDSKEWPSYRKLTGDIQNPKKQGVMGIVAPHGHLIHILSSGMTVADLKEAFRMTLAVGRYNGSYSVPIPVCLGGSTPLDSAVLLAGEIVAEFKDRTKVQIVNTVFLTDGDATDRLLARQGDGWGSGVTVLRDRLKEYAAEDVWGANGTRVLLRWLKDKVGGNILGVFVTDSDRQVQSVCGGTESERLDAKRHFRANGWTSTKNAGFTEYFVLRGEVRDTEEGMRQFESLDAGVLTASALKKQFLKAVEQRNGARGMIQRFVEIVA